MAESLVVSGLVSKRAELAGLAEHHRKEIQRIEGDLSHLDATLKLFAPEIDLRTLRPKAYRERNHYFKPKEAPRMILDALRVAGQPITSRAITEAILTVRGEALDAHVIEAMQKSVLTTLRSMERKGQVRVDAIGRAGVLSWGLA